MLFVVLFVCSCVVRLFSSCACVCLCALFVYVFVVMLVGDDFSSLVLNAYFA